MIYFIKLIRPINIIIIFLTMYALRFFYTGLQVGDEQETSIVEQIDFFLLVVSTLLIAAGGNIINDYFDVKADRINKPEKLIITKYIKQRWAIVSHWFLNGLALLIGAYLSIKYQSFSFIFIHLICINALWFYSVYFKRRVLIGNLLVSFLTALVPLTCGIYFKLAGLIHDSSGSTQNEWIHFLNNNYHLIIGMSIFAFLLNFAREIVKDIQDVRGDKVIHAHTLPMVIGKKNARYLTAFILFLIPVLSTFLYLPYLQNLKKDVVFFLPFVLVIIFVFICILFLIFTEKIKTTDRMLKIAMFLGLILPFYWGLLEILA